MATKLGHGNYGQVRIGHHVRTMKKYAVKILPSHMLTTSDYSSDVRREMVRCLHYRLSIFITILTIVIPLFQNPVHFNGHASPQYNHFA